MNSKISVQFLYHILKLSLVKLEMVQSTATYFN